jgi:hypothetical protein
MQHHRDLRIPDTLAILIDISTITGLLADQRRTPR